MANANAPPITTRPAALVRRAPPRAALTDPKAAKPTSVSPTVAPIRRPDGTSATSSTGSRAPMAKLSEETTDACSGLARTSTSSCRVHHGRGEAQLIALRQLSRHLAGQVVAETPGTVDVVSSSSSLAGSVDNSCSSRARSARSVSRSRAHRDVFAGGHRQRPGGRPRDSGEQDGRTSAAGCGDADDQGGGGDEPVVRAQHAGAEPTGPRGQVDLAGGMELIELGTWPT